MDYISNCVTVIFSHYFNNKLNVNLTYNYNKIIFGDFELNNKILTNYENNEF